MPEPEFFGEGSQPRRPDTLWKIDQKILGAIRDGGGAGSGGSGDAFTVTQFAGPVIPFEFTAVTRSTVEVHYLLNGTGGEAAMQVARTGVAVMEMKTDATTNSEGVSSFRLGPGQTITVSDQSSGGLMQILRVTVYAE